jgi:hypothetical protein
MQFPHGELVERDRRQLEADPYNPDRQAPGSWDDAETIELEEAFVASSSATALPDATRSQILAAKSLYLTDVEADVLVGDRIRAGGRIYYVNEIPASDVNPFTGWQPAVEIPLDLTLG